MSGSISIASILLILAAPPEPPVTSGAPPAVPTTTGGWAFSLSEEGVFRNWRDDRSTPVREDIIDGMNRLYGLATRPGFELGVQMDVAVASPNDRAALIGPDTPPVGSTSMTWDSEPVGVAVEKKFLRFRRDWAGVEVGDTYRALGRGIALSAVKNTELDIDTSIEGASADVTWESFEASAWGGYSNPQTIAVNFPNHLRRDVRDRMAGARVLGRLAGVELGAHASALRVDPKVPGQVLIHAELYDVESADVAGASLAMPDLAGVGDFYFEANGALFRGKAGDEDRDYDGHGFYGAATVYAGPVTLLMEGKSYENLELLNVRQSEHSATPYDYSTPPTLEKENLVNYNANKAVNSNDIVGGRLSASVGLGESGALVRGTYARFEDMAHRQELGTVVVNANERIDHAYVSVERRSAGTFVQVTGGMRYQTRLAAPDVHDTQIHADADLLIPIGAVSTELKYLVYRQVENSEFTPESFTYDVNQIVASVTPVRRLAVAALVDTTTDERVLTGFGGHEGNLSKYTFGALELTVEPTESSNVRLFAGATQGGLKCSGGTCRVVPAFEGVRLEWLARF